MYPLFPDREGFIEVTKLRHCLHRHQDSELNRALDRAIERFAKSPGEAAEAKARVQHLMRDENKVIRPEDVAAPAGDVWPVSSGLYMIGSLT